MDYTAVNKLTTTDVYLFPLIMNIFDQLQRATSFSKLDLKSGYHQLPLWSQDIEKTVFVSHFGITNLTSVNGAKKQLQSVTNSHG